MLADRFNGLIDWFLPSGADDNPVLLQNMRVFNILHILGPLTALPLFILLFSKVPDAFPHAYILLGCTFASWILPFVVKSAPKHFFLITSVSVQNLVFVILYASYNYGGLASPFLLWLLTVPVAAFLVMGSTPASRWAICAITLSNLFVFFAICFWGGALPDHGASEVMGLIAAVSAVTATGFVFLLTGYYGAIVQARKGLIQQVEKQKLKALRLKTRKDEALRANSAKSDFLANMSHELRTPLNAVLGYSEILLEDAELDGRTADIADLQKISAAGKHLLSMVNDILDLSKIEAGKAELFLENFDLGRFIDEMEGIARPLAAKNNNAFVMLKGIDLGEVHLDLTKLRQSVLNLLSNAAKFTKNGQITLSIERKTIDEDDRIIIEVRDTGVGISPENMDKMFRNFSQANAAITAQFGGTGLGLSLSQNLCKLMGGYISLESVLNEGSCFTISLPTHATAEKQQDKSSNTELFSSLTEEARQVPDDATGGKYHRAGPISLASNHRQKITETQNRQVEAASEGHKTGKQNILVIDDDRNVLDVAERLLEREGFQPVCADSPESVLQLARTVRPYAIILDVFMPGLDGWDVIGTLKSDPNTADIPVVMISNSLDREKVQRHQAVGYIEKPLSSEKLKLALDSVENRQAA